MISKKWEKLDQSEPKTAPEKIHESFVEIAENMLNYHKVWKFSTKIEIFDFSKFWTFRKLKNTTKMQKKFKCRRKFPRVRLQGVTVQRCRYFMARSQPFEEFQVVRELKIFSSLLTTSCQAACNQRLWSHLVERYFRKKMTFS